MRMQYYSPIVHTFNIVSFMATINAIKSCIIKNVIGMEVIVLRANKM